MQQNIIIIQPTNKINYSNNKSSTAIQMIKGIKAIRNRNKIKEYTNWGSDKIISFQPILKRITIL